MLIIDDREDARLTAALSRIGAEFVQSRLESSDCRFIGLGPTNEEVLIGVERKKLSDLINSMKDRRLAGLQLRLMRKEHEFSFLVAEGVWRPGPAGEIEHRIYNHRLKKWGWEAFYSRDAERRSVNYRQLGSFLLTLQLKGSVRLIRTADETETAAWYATLEKWFEKPWSEHRSMDAIYCGDIPNKGHGSGWAVRHTHNEEFDKHRNGRASIQTNDEPTTLWRMAAQLPGVDSRAKPVADFFGTVRDMALAGLDPTLRTKVEKWYRENPGAAERAWREIGCGIGEKTSRAVVRAIEERGA